ncbi:glycogen debranching N-terminal domain-containing protein [Arthrobacter sp. Cr_A7]|uniref:glycogen debranching N-terminal domain-containing protein n=1 Tax=Arthrobacter sp. Cr_A7 TaxID=3031017 RepID=UPI0023DBE316|nr:glycogen debranching N-terminal domain-containing protein [Arthrobacter sp. Cr_A7]MDF2049548.1 glycogen debranching N-terminal domain-containing protein [Arthrobacter sp. Cr_A7]
MTALAPPSAVSVLVAQGAMMRGAADGSVGNAAAPAVGTEGLYVADTRLLSRWILEIDDSTFWEVGSVREPGRRHTALSPAARRNQTHDLVAFRTQELNAGGLTETLSIRNLGREPITARLQLRAGTDFADQFTVRTDGRTFDLSGATSSLKLLDDGSLTFDYTHTFGGRTFKAGLHVTASTTPSVSPEPEAGRFVGAVLSWDLPLAGGETKTLTIAALSVGDSRPPAPTPAGSAADGSAGAVDPLARQSLKDLDSLLMPCPVQPALTIPAAGLPWFLTLFGRDSLLTSMLTRAERPQLLGDVVRALAATQGTVYDPLRVEQPGKMVHEVRVSELAQLGAVPYGRYYGTVDSTPLFLMALGCLDDPVLLRELERPARAAVEWILGDGGLWDTGFLRYTPDPNGLLHQGWKDSFDAVADADGREPAGAIALAEVQGYTWRGLQECARLAAEQWGDQAWADTLQQVANELKARFRQEFWMEQHNFPALAVDGDGWQVNALASNAGHLLWTGILDPEDARAVTSRLLREDFFTGWGIRTLATGQRYYHPMSYHNGSVWPHDTMLAAEGMAAYGFLADAERVADGMREAAMHFGNSLPELFGGFSRADFPVPVQYHHAGSPQAWAAAAGLAAVRLTGGANAAVGGYSGAPGTTVPAATPANTGPAETVGSAGG